MNRSEHFIGQSEVHTEDVHKTQSRSVEKLIANFEKSVGLKDKELGSREEQEGHTTLSAKLKRRSFAKKKPLARVSLIKSTGLSASFDCGSLQAVKTINRRAAFRKIANQTGNSTPLVNKKVSYCAESHSNLPGSFSPRTSLKRQRSISADSLAEIRSGRTSTSGRSMSQDNVNVSDAGEIVLGHSGRSGKGLIEKKTSATGMMSDSECPLGRNVSGCSLNMKSDAKGKSDCNAAFERSSHAEKVNTEGFGPRGMCPVSGEKGTFLQRRCIGEGCSQDSIVHPNWALKSDAIRKKPYSMDEDIVTNEVKTQRPAERTVSDSVVISDKSSNPRLVTFARQSAKRPPAMKKLQRTPTPYWQTTAEDDSDEEFGEGNVRVDVECGDCLDLPPK